MYAFATSADCPYSVSRISLAFEYPSSVNGRPSMSQRTDSSSNSFKWANFVKIGIFVDSISDVNFPQNGSHDSNLPSNFVIGNFGNLAAEFCLHCSLFSASLAFSFSRSFSNSAFCSSNSRSNSRFFL